MRPSFAGAHISRPTVPLLYVLVLHVLQLYVIHTIKAASYDLFASIMTISITVKPIGTDRNTTMFLATIDNFNYGPEMKTLQNSLWTNVV